MEANIGMVKRKIAQNQMIHIFLSIMKLFHLFYAFMYNICANHLQIVVPFNLNGPLSAKHHLHFIIYDVQTTYDDDIRRAKKIQKRQSPDSTGFINAPSDVSTSIGEEEKMWKNTVAQSTANTLL